MIVRMKHLDLVCVSGEREKTLERLRSLGAVHLDLGSAGGAAVSAARGEIEEAEKAVRLVRKARGKGFSDEIRPRTVAEILALEADRETLTAEKERLEREIKTYAPYGDFDPELAKKLERAGIRLVLNADGSFAIGEEEAPPPAGVARVRLPEVRLSKLREQLARVETRIGVDTAKLAGSDERAILRRHPELCARMEFEQAKELMASKGAVSVVSGWIPEPNAGELAAAARESGWGYLLRDPAEGEVPPSLILPPKFVRPVKVLFEGLGIAPAYDEADVSVPFLCYFALFFAMLVGDGGYGAIIFALTLWGWRKFRRRGPAKDAKAVVMRSWLVLMTVFSLATIGWGAISNTWFGAGLPCCANWPTVKWLGDPSYKNMMFLCFTIGVSHLMLARIWNGISLINDRRCLGQFAWAGILFFMYWITNTIVGIFTGGIPAWLYVVFGLSFVTVFLQSKGIEKGMLFLNVMSTLGDVISYVRLFAVGLASVKVAENFNNMALSIFNCTDLVWVKPVLAVFMALVLLFGHGLNFAMAGLSILVHAVRLNTLEFSNHKGISWAGYAFRPFKPAKE